MASYIVSKLDETTVGGLGHLFDDIVTSYILSEVFDLEHLHFPFQNCPSHVFTQWEEFFNFQMGKIILYMKLLKTQEYGLMSYILGRGKERLKRELTGGL